MVWEQGQKGLVPIGNYRNKVVSTNYVSLANLVQHSYVTVGRYVTASMQGHPHTHARKHTLASYPHTSLVSTHKSRTQAFHPGTCLTALEKSLGQKACMGTRLHTQFWCLFLTHTSLVPRPETARRKGPGFHCLRMR